MMCYLAVHTDSCALTFIERLCASLLHCCTIVSLVLHSFVNDLSKKLEAEGDHASVPFTPMVQRNLMRKETVDIKPGDVSNSIT
jgi:hypothetical protein